MKTNNATVLGIQYGDEGKGKVIDLLAARADLVVRCQGGANAGHTVVVGGHKTVLHLLPSGILNRDATCVIGHGVAVDPVALCHEIDEMKTGGDDVTSRLVVSDQAHLVLPSHPHLDRAHELARGNDKIGTTLRGIGPCYTDKAARNGIRASDLCDMDVFERKLRGHIARSNITAVSLGAEPLDVDTAVRTYLPMAQRVAPLITDTISLLHDATAHDRTILFEGAQGIQLDIDVGTYPFVTSSPTGIGGIIAGSGLSHKDVGEVVGVVKAYTTRIGSGHFVTELTDARGEAIRQRGAEFGATTGRPRRCGWLDLVLVGYACRLNGVDSIALTKLDILTGEPNIRVCIGYHLDGRTLHGPPARIEDAARVKPIYKTLPGWSQDISHCRSFNELPANARAYVDFIQSHIPARIGWIGVGPDRADIIIR